MWEKRMKHWGIGNRKMERAKEKKGKKESLCEIAIARFDRATSGL